MSDLLQSRWNARFAYATEGIKVLLILNGGAAAGLLTFIGHSPELRTGMIALAIAFFGLGALVAAFNFGAAYLAQLKYGESEMAENPTAIQSAAKARFWHNAGYYLFGLSAVLFLGALILASLAIVYAPKTTLKADRGPVQIVFVRAFDLHAGDFADA